MTTRRDVLRLLPGVALLAGSRALAQAKAPLVIGWMHMSSREMDAGNLVAFKEGLAALGWKEGSQYVVEERWAEGRVARLQAMAEDLAKKKPAVIVSYPTQPIGPALKAMPSVPVVQVAAADPVTTGFAASMARPGGMVTGVSNVVIDTTEKFLELLLAAVPKLRRVGFLADSTNIARVRLMEQARRSVANAGIEARFAEAGKPEDLEPAISSLAAQGVEALIAMPSPLFAFERRRLVQLALGRRWPMIAARFEFADEGALLSYGIDAAAQFHRAAYFVDKILKGAKAGDIPIEQATTIELVINVKTAKALQIAIPHSLLARAHRVIQ